jgi:hypothetical protein
MRARGKPTGPDIMPIERIYIGVCRSDVHFARTCVASIRLLYPEIPIFLIKDYGRGTFSTVEIEKYFNVSIYQTERRVFGYGFSKLEPLFDTNTHRFLFLDSDTILLGPVIEFLESFPDDFIVSHENFGAKFVRDHYFDLSALSKVDSRFGSIFSGETFNSGQWVGRSGIFRREDFQGLIEWDHSARLLHPEVFYPGDQGVLNYFLTREAANGRITLKRTRFMEIGTDAPTQQVNLLLLGKKSPYKFVVHWCGMRASSFTRLPRGDILQYFDKIYHQRVPFGLLKYRLRSARRSSPAFVRRMLAYAIDLTGLRRVIFSPFGRRFR